MYLYKAAIWVCIILIIYVYHLFNFVPFPSVSLPISAVIKQAKLILFIDVNVEFYALQHLFEAFLSKIIGEAGNYKNVILQVDMYVPMHVLTCM